MNSSKAKTRKKLVNALIHLFLAVLAFIWVVPIIWVILTSFRAQQGAYAGSFIPESFTLENYRRLFTDTAVFNFPRWFANTFVVSIFTCILSTFYLVSIAYCMSRLRFQGRKKFLNIALILGMFPGFMSMIAVYYIVKGLGLTNGALKLVALTLIYSGGNNLLQFYMAKGFFDTIPKSLDEAAYVDGATKWNVFSRIIIPLSKPIVVYTVFTSFMAPWIDFILAKVIIGTDAKYYTVAIGLWNMLEKENIYQWYTRFAAGSICVSIPLAILFIVTQKYYQEGLAGAVKG